MKAIVIENQSFTHPVGASKDKVTLVTEYKVTLSLTVDEATANHFIAGEAVEIEFPKPVETPAATTTTTP